MKRTWGRASQWSNWAWSGAGSLSRRWPVLPTGAALGRYSFCSKRNVFHRSESAGAAVRAAGTALRGEGGRDRSVTGPWRAQTILSTLARARLTLDSSARYAEKHFSPFFLPTVFNTLLSRGWHAAKSVAVLGGTGVSRSIRLTNGDGRLGGHWVKVTFIFGHPIITGRPPGCLGNVLGTGAVEHLPGRMAGVTGEPWQGMSPSGSLAVKTMPSGSRSQAPGSGRPCPKVFCRHPPGQLAPGGRQMVLDPPSVTV